MIELALDVFVAKRNDEQDALEKVLFPHVSEAIQTYPAVGWYDDLLREAGRQYLAAFHEQGGKGDKPVPSVQEFVDSQRTSLDKIEDPDDETVNRVSLSLATAILNAATSAAVEGDDEEFLLEWVSMEDQKVRVSHKEANGQRKPVGEPFIVDAEEVPYPGYPVERIELWINCRCALRPVSAASVAATNEAVTRWTTGITASSSEPESHGRVIVALPNEGHEVHDIGDENKHMTLIWLGKDDENPDLDLDAVKAAVQQVAADSKPVVVPVDTTGPLGDDGATVWFTGHPEDLHDRLLEHSAIREGFEAVEQHPQFTPHVTVGYDEDPPDASEVKEIPLDRLAIWHGEDHTEYPLGQAQEDDMTETEVEQTESEASGLIPWHGVLAPEGVFSGDGRMFEPGSLTHRDLPLPLTWQKTTEEGHNGSVTVADIQGINRIGDLFVGWGHMLPIPEADEALGLMAHFGKYGVSVDADDAEMSFDEESGKVSFSKARVCSASIVSIPAFAEAFVKIGEPPAEWLEDPNAETEASLVDEALAAAAENFGRGPGWITDPVATKRIHDYWTKPGEEGYIKVGWGTPGDFNRCRIEVGAKIAENSPEDTRFLNQICAQWHHDATGFWPGDAPAERGTHSTETPEGEPAPAVSLVASGGWCAPSEWYQNPGFEPGDDFMVQDKTGEWIAPMQVTEEGRVFGHLAGWRTCHVGYEGVCVAPPHTTSDYAYFLTNIADTEDGPIPAGALTIGGGHAAGGLRPKAALAHYDSTSSVVADVTLGEDDYGIWYSGAIRPTATEDDIQTLRRSVLSGDWRKIAGEHELIAALGVNSGGFPIPRVGINNGEQVSLVAAGAIHTQDAQEPFDMQKFAAAVAKELRAQEQRREKMAAIKQRVNGAN